MTEREQARKRLNLCLGDFESETRFQFPEKLVSHSRLQRYIFLTSLQNVLWFFHQLFMFLMLIAHHSYH